jgi:dolichol-phosphate mannosyltransferase
MLDIVIPVYHEEASIEKTLRLVCEKVTTPHRIVVVADYEEDPTLPVVNQCRAKHPGVTIDILINRFGPGVVNALKTGLSGATSTYVLVTMADLSDDLSQVDEMVGIMEAGADIVCGSRYMKGGKQMGGPFLKSLISRVAGLSLYYLTKLPTRDVTNSFKLYRREKMQSLKLESQGGFELGMEIVVKGYLQGFKIEEIPTTWTDRAAGDSKFKLWKWIPHYLKWYFMTFKKGLF